MKIILSLLFFVLYVGNSVAQSEVLSTNIYRKAMHVYENHMIHGSARNPIRYFELFVEAVLTLSLMGCI